MQRKSQFDRNAQTLFHKTIAVNFDDEQTSLVLATTIERTTICQTVGNYFRMQDKCPFVVFLCL